MKTKSAGFTLIETLIVIAVVAILLAIVAPSLQGVLANNQTATLGDDLFSSIMMARSEAVRRETIVTLCAAADNTQSSCAASASTANWQNGWITFLDPAGTGTVGASTNILKLEPTLITNANINPSASSKITYQPSGLISTGAGTYTIKVAGCTGSTGGKQIVISASGHPTLSAVSCP